jgi:FkbM family methyltransferase
MRPETKLMHQANTSVTVILTTCDRKLLFLRAYKSVIEAAKMCNEPIQLIVYNDGETLVDVALQAVNNLSIQIIQNSKQNSRRGVSRARNHCLNISNGEYIMFLDDDDFIEPYSINTLLKIAREERADFVYSNTHHITENEQQVILKKVINKLTVHQIETLLVRNFIPISAFLIKYHSVREQFDPYLESHEDWDFLLSNITGLKIAFTEEVLTNITTSSSRQQRNPNHAEKLSEIFSLMYKRHPSEHHSQQRKDFLSAINRNVTPKEKTIIDCDQIELLVINPYETIQHSLINGHEFEQFTSSFAKRILEIAPIDGDIIDVGANIGTFAIPLAREMVSKKKIHCFECQKSVFLHLCSHILINQQSETVEPYCIPLADTVINIRVPQFDNYQERYTGSVSLDESVIAIREGMEGVAEPTSNCDKFVKMITSTIDMQFNQTHIALIKIDTEGMETSILKGAKFVIENSRPYIITESWSLEKFSHLRNELFELMKCWNYIIYVRNDDIVCIPEERHTQLTHKACKEFLFQPLVGTKIS